MPQLPTPNSQLPGAALPRVFLAGFPGDIGGANTEIWHTVKLWRWLGLDVTVLPLWGESGNPDFARWTGRLAGIGAEVAMCEKPERLDRVEGLPGSIVVSVCNTRFVREAERFWRLGCKLVYVPCMCFLWTAEIDLGKPFDAYVFQSNFQANTQTKELSGVYAGRRKTAVIHGAFDCAEFPYQPAPGPEPGQPWRLGRISRPHSAKYPPWLWEMFLEIWTRNLVHFEALGWSEDAEAKCGPPPRGGATGYPPGSVHPATFLSQLHVLVQLSDPAGPPENWPRVGLEAMAAGVPIVAERRGGWTEMIRDGYNGLLVDSPAEAIAAVERLLRNPPLRLAIARQARHTVQDLAHPAVIGPAWQRLFEDLLS